MSEIEKIRQRVKKNDTPRNPRYSASIEEVLAMATELENIEAVTLAFQYGYAKGYRAAKAEVRA